MQTFFFNNRKYVKLLIIAMQWSAEKMVCRQKRKKNQDLIHHSWLGMDVSKFWLHLWRKASSHARVEVWFRLIYRNYSVKQTLLMNKDIIIIEASATSETNSIHLLLPTQWLFTPLHRPTNFSYSVWNQARISLEALREKSLSAWKMTCLQNEEFLRISHEDI